MDKAELIEKIWKTGNSTVVAIPKDVLAELGVQEGDRVRIFIEPVNMSRKESAKTKTPSHHSPLTMGVLAEYTRSSRIITEKAWEEYI